MTAASRGATSCSRGAFPTYEDQTSQVCFRAYGQAFDSTEQGDCWQQSRQNTCTPGCQNSITHMLRTCANDTYEAVVQYYQKYIMIRGFNARAVLALQIMGPTNCDYSLLSADTHCNPTCSLENLANGTDQKWVNLRKCLDLVVPNHASSDGKLGEPVPVWNTDTCASDECEQHFHDLVLDCRACNTNIEFSSFLGVAAKNLVRCREAAASCKSIIASVRDACCAGIDCAPDGYPTICAYGSGGRYFGRSMCQSAVFEAETTCPLHFLNNSRLQGLYVVSVSCVPLAKFTSDCSAEPPQCSVAPTQASLLRKSYHIARVVGCRCCTGLWRKYRRYTKRGTGMVQTQRAAGPLVQSKSGTSAPTTNSTAA